MDQDRTEHWRELCNAAANEFDSTKLMDLIAELNRTLEERDQKRQNVVGVGRADQTRTFDDGSALE